MAVTAEGRRAVSASRDNTLKVWDLESGSTLRTLERQPGPGRGVAVAADGRRAVSTSADNTLKVWDLETGRTLVEFHCDANVECCAFADARNIIAGDRSGRLHFFLLEEWNDAMFVS